MKRFWATKNCCILSKFRLLQSAGNAVDMPKSNSTHIIQSVEEGSTKSDEEIL